MRKLLIYLFLFIQLLSMAGCVANIPETLITEVGEPYDPMTGEFLTPPKGYVVTQDGNIPLTTGGYSWSVDAGDGTGNHMIADQYMWPLPEKDMNTAVVTHTDNPVALAWQVTPDTVRCLCWPVDYKTTGASEEAVEFTKEGFNAKPGSYIYELSAAWGNHGASYSGKATFYIHVIAEMEGEA